MQACGTAGTREPSATPTDRSRAPPARGAACTPRTPVRDAAGSCGAPLRRSAPSVHRARSRAAAYRWERAAPEVAARSSACSRTAERSAATYRARGSRCRTPSPAAEPSRTSFFDLPDLDDEASGFVVERVRLVVERVSLRQQGVLPRRLALGGETL